MASVSISGISRSSTSTPTLPILAGTPGPNNLYNYPGDLDPHDTVPVIECECTEDLFYDDLVKTVPDDTRRSQDWFHNGLRALTAFRNSQYTKILALAYHIVETHNFDHAIDEFFDFVKLRVKDFVLDRWESELFDVVLRHRQKDSVLDRAITEINGTVYEVHQKFSVGKILRTCNLLKLFERFCSDNPLYNTPELQKLKISMETALSDCARPHLWYPSARKICRKIYYHNGPTNSGKTYDALEGFKRASSGIYCAPLRLLALEVSEIMNKHRAGFCNLRTGQETETYSSAKHLSCTVELADLKRKWDIAVIDEIQMIGPHEERSGAWTRALLGLQAPEIHLCGDATAIEVIRKLCELTGDSYHVLPPNERKTTLTMEKDVTYGNLQPGDCVVIFSGIEKMDDLIRQMTRRQHPAWPVKLFYRIHGSLPPAIKRQQQDLFNANSDKSILLATDAVGMGLNLDIRRIVFFSLHKFSGGCMRELSSSEVKQIAGRAGRFGKYDRGSFTCVCDRDYDRLKQLYEEDLTPCTKIGLSLELEPLTKVERLYPNLRFDELLDVLQETSTFGKLFYPCYSQVQKMCVDIGLYGCPLVGDVFGVLPLEVRWKFYYAPAKRRQDIVQLINFAISPFVNMLVEENESLKREAVERQNYDGNLGSEREICDDDKVTKSALSDAAVAIIRSNIERIYPLTINLLPANITWHQEYYKHDCSLPLRVWEKCENYIWLSKRFDEDPGTHGRILFPDTEKAQAWRDEAHADIVLFLSWRTKREDPERDAKHLFKAMEAMCEKLAAQMRGAR